MKNYNICIKTALAVFAVALSACSSDDDIADNNSNSQEKPVTNKTMTFRATMDDGSGSNSKATRTDFNGNNTIWATDDNIYIQNKASVPDETDRPAYAEFGITDGVGTKDADFSGGPIRANMDGTSDQFYAYYPSSSFDTNNEVMTGNIPTVQTPTDGTYPQTLHYMTAYSTNSTFKFKNVCALLKITLTGNGSTNTNPVCRVKVVANPTLSAMNAQEFTYTNIAGGFTATIGSDGTATTTATGTKNTYVELHAAGDNTAKTSLGNGTFYMVVLPAQLDNGFTLLLEKTDGIIYQRINAKKMAFERNKMYNLQSYDCSGTISGMTELTDVVDLDLPSGTLWATKNLQSSDPLVGNATIQGFVANETDYGSYFSWGKNHAQATYTNPSRTNQTLRESADMIYSYSPFDHKYCTPIYAQMYEFYYHFPDAYKTSNTGNGDKGARFTAPTGTGRSIWLPYGGHYYSVTVGVQRLRDKDEAASYWSRTDIGSIGVDRYEDAYCLDMYEDNGIPILGHTAIISGADSKWSDDKVTGRQLRAVASNFKIAPIYNDSGKEITW